MRYKNIKNLNNIYILTNGTNYVPELKNIDNISNKMKFVFTYHDEQLTIDKFCDTIKKYMSDKVF